MIPQWAWQQLHRLDRTLSVRFKILGIVIGCVLLTSLVGIIDVTSANWASLQREQSRRGLAVALNLAAQATDPMLTNDLFRTAELAAAAKQTYTDVSYVMVLDANHEVVAHTLPAAPSSELVAANTVRGDERFHVRLLHTTSGDIQDIAVPIYGHHAGEVRVGLSRGRLRTLLWKSIIWMIVVDATAAVLGTAAAYLVAALLMRPLVRLVQAANQVGTGDFSVRVPERSADEVGQLSAAFNRMTGNLAASREALASTERARQQLMERLLTAQEDERKRLSRELHDGMGQTLTSLKLGLRVLEETTDMVEVRTTAAALRDLATAAVEEVHALAWALRPQALDDLGFVAALRRCVDEFAERSGISVDFQLVGLMKDRLPTAVETALYRIVQESLSNVYRHSGATQASVIVESRPTAVQVIVEDNGKGFEVGEDVLHPRDERSLGLFGMHERAALVGGTLTVESTPGVGTTVFVAVPTRLSHPLEDGSSDDQRIAR